MHLILKKTGNDCIISSCVSETKNKSRKRENDHLLCVGYIRDIISSFVCVGYIHTEKDHIISSFMCRGGVSAKETRGYTWLFKELQAAQMPLYTR